MDEVTLRGWARANFDEPRLYNNIDVYHPIVQEEFARVNAENHAMVWVRYIIDENFDDTLYPHTFMLESIWDDVNGEGDHDPAFAEIAEKKLVRMAVGDILYIPIEEADDSYPYIVKRIK